MIVNWKPLMGALHDAMLEDGARPPEQPVPDGRWHPCGQTPGQKTAWYLLFPALPARALYTGSDGQPRIWRPDDRVLTRAAEAQLAQAIARLPAQAVRPTVRPDPSGNRITAVGTVHGAPESTVTKPIPRPASRAESAKAFLASLLVSGPIPTIEIKVRAREAGLAWATVRRVQKQVGAIAIRTGFGGAGGWSWHLSKALSSKDPSP